MLLQDFLHLTYDYNNLIDYLCDIQVLRREIICSRCQQIVHLRYSSESLILQCINHYYKRVRGRKRIKKICNFSISPFSGTWFSQSRLGIVKTRRFIAYFLMIQPPRQTFLEQQLEMSSTSVVDWTNFCRELLAQWVKNDKKLLGGPEIIVEVDEAKIGRRKYNRGRIIRGQWIFGAIERNSRRKFIIPLEDRSAATLTRIIQQHIAPGTIIHSDCWRGYSSLNELNYIHRTVNHSQNFVDPVTGVHTQNIERLWRDMRAALPRFGLSQEHYIHYLAEYLFKKQYTFNERIPEFFKIMASLYPLRSISTDE